MNDIERSIRQAIADFRDAPNLRDYGLDRRGEFERDHAAWNDERMALDVSLGEAVKARLERVRIARSL